MNHVLEMAIAMAKHSVETKQTLLLLEEFYAEREKSANDQSFGLSAMKSDNAFVRTEEYLYQTAEHYCGSEPIAKAQGTTVEELKDEVEMANFLAGETARAYLWGLGLAWSIMTDDQRKRFEEIVTH